MLPRLQTMNRWLGRLFKPDEVHGMQLKLHSKWRTLSNHIILDTGSTIAATFMNLDFVTNIRLAARPLTMTTDAGSKKLNPYVTL